MKWTSVACAYLMVIAAFYVMTANVSAEEVSLPDDDADEILSNVEHADRRITISNSMASSPCVAVGPDGITHIAWVDGRTGSQSVSWKCSNDSMSTFTSDKTITTSYYSISNISIVLGSAFGTAIAFEGKLTADAMPSVYFLYSEDDDDWSSAYAVSVGSSPSLTTDDDGYNDNIDRYMGDAVLRVSILEYRTKEDINYDDDRTIFFVIKYNGEMLSTKRMAAHTDTLYSPGWTYDIDIAETVTSVSVIFYAVADDAGTIPGDDIKLDVSSTSNLEHTVTWTLSTTQYQTSFEGTCGWLDNDADGYMKVGLQRCVAEKAKVIVINGTGEDGDYGLDEVSTGVYRYSADDQVFLINLNVSTANARFQQGMNTIILPRAIALQCQLNDTLYNLQNISSTPLAGASFYSTDQQSASASSHVIAVITKNVTAAEAEDILTMLTHNSTGARIGNNVTITAASVYLLHLPNDVLSSIPTNVLNSGLGGAPNFFDPLDVISDIANLVFDFLIWIATGGVLLLWAHLVIMGLEIIANLITTAIAVVEGAVDAIVDALCAFVDWIVDFVCDSFNALIAEPWQGLMDDLGEWVYGLLSLIETASMDIEGGEDNASASLAIAMYILDSDFFKALMVIALSILVIITAVSLLGPFGFIGAMIAPLLIDLMISGMTAAVFLIGEAVDALGWIAGTIWQILGDDLTVGVGSIMGATIGTIGWIASLMSLYPAPEEVKGFILSSIGWVISWWGTRETEWIKMLIIDIAGMALTAIGAWDVFINPSPRLFNNPTAKGIMKGLVIIETGISLFQLSTVVANHE
jgi:hypothetical protein